MANSEVSNAEARDKIKMHREKLNGSSNPGIDRKILLMTQQCHQPSIKICLPKHRMYSFQTVVRVPLEVLQSLSGGARDIRKKLIEFAKYTNIFSISHQRLCWP